jgi:hypothetical protein
LGSPSRIFLPSVYTRSTRRHIPEDDILRSHRRKNLKPYIVTRYFYVVLKMD